jgi:WD40 repeat protein
MHTKAYGITRMAGCPANGYLAFCEVGTNPHVFVYSTQPAKFLFTLPNVSELELADLTFSSCGSRLYTVSRATSKRLNVFSTITGQQLPGCELALPVRFDKVSVFPGHKDQIALVRSTSVRLVTMKKSFETYIVRLHPNSIPADVDISISAFSWLPSGYFLFATRQGLLCTMNGMTGALLHCCQAPQPITSIAYAAQMIVTSHLGNQLNFWFHNEPAIPTEGNASMTGLPPMDDPLDGRPSVYALQRVADLQSVSATLKLGQQMNGQVAHLQVTPSGESMALTTAEGELWLVAVPQDDPQEPALDQEYSAEELKIRPLAWFHTHQITDVIGLGKEARVCASADEGGRLKIWEVSRGPDSKGFRVLRFSSAITSLTADATGKFLLAGSDSGCIHAVQVDDWRASRVVDTLRISEAGVVSLRAVTHQDRCMVVAALLFNNKVALLNFTFKTGDVKLHMIGFLNCGPNVSLEDLAFHTHDFKASGIQPSKLIVTGSCAFGDVESQWLWYFKLPSLDYDSATVEIARDTSPLYSLKLGGEPGKNKSTAVSSVSKDMIAVGFSDGCIALYPVPEALGYPSANAKAASPATILAPHSQFITCIAVSPDSAWLVSSSMDGQIRRTSIEDGASAKGSELTKTLHNPYAGGILRFFTPFTENSSIYLSTGGVDGVVVWSDPAHKAKAPPIPDQAKDVDERMMASAVLDVDDRSTVEYKLWMPIGDDDKAAAAAAEAGDDPELSAVAMTQRKALLVEIDVLSKRLQSMVQQNSQVPELEVIPRKDFCVDHEARNALAATTKERCDALRAQLQKENHVRQLRRDRLIKEFWDPMRTKGCMINSLVGSLSVSNYPERIVSEEEATVAKKLRVMRQVEHLESEMTRTGHPKLQSDVLWTSNKFTTGRENFVVNWWKRNAESAQSQGVAFFDENAEEEGGEAKQEDSPKHVAKAVPKSDEPQDTKFLYEPFELLTNSRRRLQIHLLQSLAADYRMMFNKEFEECQGTKTNIMDSIKDRVVRMRAILKELKSDDSVPEPKLHLSEDAQAILNIKDEELVAAKYITEEEKKAMAEAAAKEEERLRQLRENDAGTRALREMMGGTLKTKKDLSALEIVLDKEPWMDEVAEEDMTDAQLAALKEFQAKEKALLEEQDKYRKQLDAEFKKLGQEVDDLKQQFEMALKDLHHKRFASDARFFCQELYCVRLQLALLQNVEDNSVTEQATKEVEAAKEKLAAAEQRLDAFSRKVTEKREKQDERVRHEREVASAQHFRQQFASTAGLEQEQVQQLLAVFRRRRDPAKAAAAADVTQSGASMAAGSYPDLGTAQAEASVPGESLDDDIPLSECPEGVDEASFKKMNELRRDRFKAEAEVQKGQAVLQEMAGLQAHFQAERDTVKEEYDRLCAELADHKELMEREIFDVEVLFKLRQGQVEVPQAAVVTDYSDAIVIDTEVVECRNRRILELGKDKVGDLGKIKEFRKKQNLIQWEHKMLAHQTLDLEERTKDVHMLRVTKGLQTLLKGGEDSRNKADADLLERKIEHLNTTTEQKEGSLKKQHQSGVRATKMRKMENNMLEKKLKELQQNVIQREHIRRLRAPPGGGAGHEKGEKPKIVGGGGRIEENQATIRAAQSSFREVRTRQNLMDAAKKHTDEIEVLRRELDKLRQRTFPSFVQLHEEQPANPDAR